MNKKNLAILMRARMRGAFNQEPFGHYQQRPQPAHPNSPPHQHSVEGNNSTDRITLKDVKEWMQASISIPAGKLELADANLEEFSQGYLILDQEGRRELLVVLARDYDVNRSRVRDLMRQYLSLEPHGGSNNTFYLYSTLYKLTNFRDGNGVERAWEGTSMLVQ